MNRFNYLQSLQSTKRLTIVWSYDNGKKIKKLIKRYFPPNNADIDFSFLHRYKITTASLSLSLSLPETWDWRNSYSIDDIETKEKKKWIDKPRNQEQCGSCWAVSTAGAVSDMFVVAGMVNFAPKLSATYALSCYGTRGIQSQCGGGNSGMLMDDIAKFGLTTDRCVDYSWCEESKDCTHGGVSYEELSKQLPSPCGCYFNSNNKLAYYLDNKVQTLDYDDNDYFNKVKKHILTYGPVVGGYIVLDNFYGGDFSKSNDVYIESVDYGWNSKNYFLNRAASVTGSHAVSILGWGVAKNTQYKDKNGNEKKGDVSYWYVRNTWGSAGKSGSTWGIYDGYFKIAMYPYNQTSQFDKIVSTMLAGGGGIVLGIADRIKDSNTGTITKNKSPRLESDSFYKGVDPEKEEEKNNNDIPSEPAEPDEWDVSNESSEPDEWDESSEPDKPDRLGSEEEVEENKISMRRWIYIVTGVVGLILLIAIIILITR